MSAGKTILSMAVVALVLISPQFTGAAERTCGRATSLFYRDSWLRGAEVARTWLEEEMVGQTRENLGPYLPEWEAEARRRAGLAGVYEEGGGMDHWGKAAPAPSSQRATVAEAEAATTAAEEASSLAGAAPTSPSVAPPAPRASGVAAPSVTATSLYLR